MLLIYSKCLFSLWHFRKFLCLNSMPLSKEFRGNILHTPLLFWAGLHLGKARGGMSLDYIGKKEREEWILWTCIKVPLSDPPLPSMPPTPSLPLAFIWEVLCGTFAELCFVVVKIREVDLLVNKEIVCWSILLCNLKNGTILHRSWSGWPHLFNTSYLKH